MKYHRYACVLALLAAAPASAQEPADTFQLGEILVTATRTPLPRTAVSAHVTVLDGAALRARGISRVVDALRDAGVGSVAQIGAPGAVASLFLRGGESDYVQVLIDGVQVNDPGGAFDWAHLSTSDVERIEVVRGPVSVLYGSDAVSGVVQIFTRAGRGRPRLDADLGVGTAARVGAQASGSFATWHGSVAASGSSAVAGRPLAWSMTAARQISDGTYAFNNDYENSNFSARAGYRLPDGTAVSLVARQADQRFHYPTDGAGNVVDHNRFTDGTARSLAAALDRQVNGWLRGIITLSSYRNETGGDDAPDEPGQGFSRSGARVRRDAAELRLDAALPRAFTLSVGGEVERQHGRTWFRSDGPFGPFADSSRAARATRAAYTQLVGRIGRLGLTGGVRLDDSDQFGRFATGRAGITLQLSQAVSAHAAWGTGFKEPTFFETYATGFARGNPDLAPEQSRSGELGLRVQMRSLQVSATAFDQRFRNLIQYTAAPPQPEAPSYFNVGRTRARGIDADAALFFENVTLRGTYALVDTRVLDDGFGTDRQFAAGKTLLRRPAHQASLGLEWRAHRSLNAELRLRHTGARADLDFTDPVEWQGVRVTLPAYTTADILVRYDLQLARGAAALQAGIQNLWNERYAEIYNFPRPGRMFTAGVRYGLSL